MKEDLSSLSVTTTDPLLRLVRASQDGTLVGKKVLISESLYIQALQKSQPLFREYAMLGTFLVKSDDGNSSFVVSISTETQGHVLSKIAISQGSELYSLKGNCADTVEY